MWLSRTPHILANQLGEAAPDLRVRIAAFRGSACLFSLVSILAPILLFALGIWLLNKVIDRDSLIHLSGLDMEARFKGSIDPVVSAVNDFSGRLRFSGPQIMFTATGWVAILGAPWVIWRMIRAHGGIELPMLFL